MPKCDLCGKETSLPYNCAYCGGKFCSKHRLPENHVCDGLDKVSKKSEREGRIYRGVSDDLKTEPEREKPESSFNIPIDFGEESGRGKKYGEKPSLSSSKSLLKSFLFRNVTSSILTIIFLVYIFQIVVESLLGTGFYRNTFIFYLAPSQGTILTKPWTLLTGIFAHGSFLHLFINGLVLFFIGSALERRIGQKKFIYLFLGAGLLSSAAQIIVTGPGYVVLGASGAIFGLLGALTVISPRMPILLFFFLPMELWMLTLGYGGLEAVLAITGGGGAIGHMAHFSGLLVGLVYGYKLRKELMEKYRGSLGALLKKYGL